MLPRQLRNAILRAYVPGQEITKTPSAKYLVTAALVQKWIKDPKSVESIIHTPIDEDI